MEGKQRDHFKSCSLSWTASHFFYFNQFSNKKASIHIQYSVPRKQDGALRENYTTLLREKENKILKLSR